MAITVELPPGRVSARRAVRLAYAIDRLAGTRFAEGAYADRRRMIAFGQDPREISALNWHSFVHKCVLFSVRPPP